MEGESNFMVVQHLMEQYDPKSSRFSVTNRNTSGPNDAATTDKDTTMRESDPY